jgi:hypothetical protein
VTEDEAKTKGCCGPRNAGIPAEDGDLLCIASACMAWRAVPVTEHVLADDQSDTWAAAGWTLYFREDGQKVARMGGGGYCGLAGAPR